jgi:hypothetical protein
VTTYAAASIESVMAGALIMVAVIGVLVVFGLIAYYIMRR